MATTTAAPLLPTGLARRDDSIEGIFETTTTEPGKPMCTPFFLPPNGTLVIDGATFTIDSGVQFTPACTHPTPTGGLVIPAPSITNVKAPFHSSETPQAYATGAATVLSWMLVVMLLITPRTFFVGGVGGGVGLLGGRRGIISGAQGRTSVIGVGSRPWLQKVAAFSVAISLTIATADTFQVAERQYSNGFMDIDSLRTEVTNSLQIKISRVISDIFLWLAQVQTLVRLFPRHREKVLMEWVGFGLIIFDTVFSCLNNFATLNLEQNNAFKKAIPTLSDTFQLTLSILYFCWVLYYVFHKRRYAFYHSLMWNVSLVAFLSILSLSSPIIFFIIDIANHSIAGWGEYFQWVGLAAASVIVWEWVERIEALEREEKKDGILGREIFDDEDRSGDENGAYRRRVGRRGHRAAQSSALEDARPDLGAMAVARPRASPQRPGELRGGRSRPASSNAIVTGVTPINPPPQTTSPISRSDTVSPASTVYTVRYNTFNLINPPVTRHIIEQRRLQSTPIETQVEEESADMAISHQETQDTHGSSESVLKEQDLEVRRQQDRTQQASALRPPQQRSHGMWFALPTFFKQAKTSPPAQLRQGQVIDPVPLQPAAESQPMSARPSNWDFRARLAVDRATRVTDLPVTIIPAPPRGNAQARPWSPMEVQREQDRRRESQAAATTVDGSEPGGSAAASQGATARWSASEV